MSQEIKELFETFKSVNLGTWEIELSKQKTKLLQYSNILTIPVLIIYSNTLWVSLGCCSEGLKSLQNGMINPCTINCPQNSFSSLLFKRTICNKKLYHLLF